MKTDRIFLNSTVQRHEDMQLWVADYAKEYELSPKDALRVSLLLEETVGMVRNLMNGFEAELWLDGNRDGCTLYLDILAAEEAPAAKSAKAVPTGFMAKIAELLQCAFRFESEEDVPDDWLDAIPGALSFGARNRDQAVQIGQWSLGNYRQALKEKIQEDAAARADLEDLEKSVVASIADDVIIGIRDNRVRMVITRRF